MGRISTWWTQWRSRRRKDWIIRNQIRFESKAVRAMRQQLADTVRRANEMSVTARENEKESRRVREELEHQIKRLECSLELARMENNLLVATHESDVGRRMAEVAIFEKKAKGLMEFAGNANADF